MTDESVLLEEPSRSQSLSEESEYLESLSSSSFLLDAVIGDGELRLHHLYSDPDDSSVVAIEDGSWEKVVVVLDPMMVEGETVLPAECEFKFVTSFSAYIHGRILASIPNTLYKPEGYTKHMSFPGIFTGATESTGYVMLHGTIEVRNACWKFTLDATLFDQQVFPFILASDVVPGVSVRDLKGLSSIRGLDLFKPCGLKRVFGERYLFFTGEFIFVESTISSLYEMLGRMGRDMTTQLSKACATIGLPKPVSATWGESYYGKWREGGPKKYNFRKLYQCIQSKRGMDFTVPFDDRFAVMAQLSSVPTRNVKKSSILIFHAILEPMLEHMLYEGYSGTTNRYNVGQRVRYSIDVGQYRKGPEVMDVQFMRQSWTPQNMQWIFPETYGAAVIEQFIVKLPRNWYPVLRISVSRLHVLAYDFKDMVVPLGNEDFNFLTIPPKWWDREKSFVTTTDTIYTNMSAYGMTVSANPEEFGLLNAVGTGVAAVYVKVEADHNFDRCNDGVDVPLLVKKELLIQGNSNGMMEAIISLIAEVNVECMRKSLEDWLMDNSKGRFNDLNFVDKLWRIMHKCPQVNKDGPLPREWETVVPKRKSTHWKDRTVDPVLGRSLKRYSFKKSKKVELKKKIQNLSW